MGRNPRGPVEPAGGVRPCSNNHNQPNDGIDATGRVDLGPEGGKTNRGGVRP